MINMYYVTYETYCNGKYVGEYNGKCLSNTDEHEQIIPITWDNLDDVAREYGLVLKFNVWLFKKGRRVAFYEGLIPDIKEWKQKDLNVELRIVYKKATNCSLQEILDYRDSELAIQYLKERFNQ